MKLTEDRLKIAEWYIYLYSQPCTFPYEQSANQVWSLHRPRSVPSQTYAEHEQNEELPVICNLV